MRHKFGGALFLALVAFIGLGPIAAPGAPAARADDEPAPPPGREPIFEGLGAHGRKVTTASPEAQRYFDQGLCFLYAFNHDEAVRSFRQAAELDPGCAMAWWGVAIALGPHINNPLVPEERGKAAWEAIDKARSRPDAAGAVERALIEAASRRYAWPQPEDRKALDEAYAAAMEAVWRDHPRDADVGALLRRGPDGPAAVGPVDDRRRAAAGYARRCWKCWRRCWRSGRTTRWPATSTSTRSRRRRIPRRRCAPRTGCATSSRACPTWSTCRRTSTCGWGAGGRRPRRTSARSRPTGRTGPSGPARVLPALHAPQPAHARLRRPDAGRERAGDRRGRRDAGRAADRVGAPERGDRRRLLRHAAGGPDAVRAVGRDPGGPGARGDVPDRAGAAARGAGVAFAAPGRVEQARGAQEEFRSARKQVAEGARFGNSPANVLLDVAEHLLAGEILYREGKEEEAFGELREAVRAEDALGYDEPPDWIQPVRHAPRGGAPEVGPVRGGGGGLSRGPEAVAGQRLVAVRADAAHSSYGARARRRTRCARGGRRYGRTRTWSSRRRASACRGCEG